MPGGAGGTFLDWSIHYLSSPNLTKDYIEKKTFMPSNGVNVPSNPMKQYSNLMNAHLHCKTHPKSMDEFARIWDVFVSNEWDCDIFTTYTVNDMQNHALYDDIITKFPRIYKNMIFEYLPCHVDVLFMWQYDRTTILNKHPSFDDEYSHTWDVREKWALFYNNMIKKQISVNKIAESNNVYKIDFNIFINSLDTIAEDVLIECGEMLKPHRFAKWLEIYNMWQHLVGIDFINNLDKIVSDIINNNIHDLSGYDMTLGKEIVLSKKLLFEHNLSLKTFGIDVMPLNTTEWHNLLEENVYHDLSKYKA